MRNQQVASPGFKSAIKFSLSRFNAFNASSAVAWFAAHYDPSIRKILPEPVNVFNHVGNVCLSSEAGVVAGWLGHTLYSHLVEKSSDDAAGAQRKARAVVVGSALAVGATLNALVETKIGISLTHMHNTIDPLDFAYGVAAAVGGGLSYRTEGVPDEATLENKIAQTVLSPQGM